MLQSQRYFILISSFSTIVTLTACSQSDNTDDAGSTTDSSIESPSRISQKAKALFAKYGVLRTIAGKGEIDQDGRSDWQDSFEGGPAVEAELSRPHMAMADDQGNIFIADKDAHAIRKVTLDGNIVTVAGTNEAGDGADSGEGTELQLSAPNGLWVFGNGTVFILDLRNKKIRRLDPSGEMRTLFSVDDGFGLGRGLWVSDDETLVYVACGDHVKKWTPSNGIEVYADGFRGLGNLVVDPDGQLVVTDRGDHRVFRIDNEGNKTVIAGDGSTSGGGSGSPVLETGLDEVRGVWFLEDGSYFLATHHGSQVWYVDTDGIINLFVDGSPDASHVGDGEPFNTPGLKISEPRAVTMDREGDVIITEHDNGYIRMVEQIAAD
jgi:hypothetical protein